MRNVIKFPLSLILKPSRLEFYIFLSLSTVLGRKKSIPRMNSLLTLMARTETSPDSYTPIFFFIHNHYTALIFPFYSSAAGFFFSSHSPTIEIFLSQFSHCFHVYLRKNPYRIYVNIVNVCWNVGVFVREKKTRGNQREELA